MQMPVNRRREAVFGDLADSTARPGSAAAHSVHPTHSAQPVHAAAQHESASSENSAAAGRFPGPLTSCPLFASHVAFRPVRRRDIASLHQHCLSAFPVRYNGAFYDEMLNFGVTLLAASRVPVGDLAGPLACHFSEETGWSHERCRAQSTAMVPEPSFMQTQQTSEVDDASTLEEPFSHVVGEIMVRLEEEDFGWINRLLEQFCGWQRTRRAYIATLSVDPLLKRRGLASLLLRKLLVVLERERVSHLTLHVKADNHAAIKFYQKEGFQIWRELPRHYFIAGQHEDALLMGRELLSTVADLDNVYVGRRPRPLTIFNFWQRLPQAVIQSISTAVVPEGRSAAHRQLADDV